MWDPTFIHYLNSRIRPFIEIHHSIIIGVAGPQGSGKSSLAVMLHGILPDCDIITLSLDDFYLTTAGRIELAGTSHPLLRTRGHPGTHDTKSLISTLHDLRNASTTSVTWPKFTKCDDDRSASSNCMDLTPGMKRVIIVEGWCIGCVPLTDVEVPINDLESLRDPECTYRRYIDSVIRTDFAELHDLIDLYIYIKPTDLNVVIEWGEEQARASGEVIDVREFYQYFERITLDMWNGRRIRTDIEVVIGPGHEITQIIK